MAALKKPIESCSCGATKNHREYHPERWVCDGCQAVLTSRKPKPDKTKCNKCGAARGSKLFKQGKNTCMDCHNIYMAEWRKDNPAHREYRKDMMVRLRLQGNVRDTIQRSPESFIKYLVRMLGRPSNQRKKRNNKGINPKRLAILNDVQIDLSFLVEMYEAQQGRCALSSLEMKHVFGDPRSISIDRIDSDKGYVPGNVQLVCQCINKMKGLHSQEDMVSILSGIRESSVLSRLQVNNLNLSSVCILDTDKVFVMLGELLQREFWLEGLSIGVGMADDDGMLAAIHIDLEQASFDSVPANQPAIMIMQSSESTTMVDCEAFDSVKSGNSVFRSFSESFEFEDPGFVDGVVDFVRRGIELQRKSATKRKKK